jgi:ABC-type uncharacterized transport system ATPase subunit
LDWKFKVGGIRKQELSKGMAQKIQFVVCVLHKPNVDFDEPFLVLT